MRPDFDAEQTFWQVEEQFGALSFDEYGDSHPLTDTAGDLVSFLLLADLGSQLAV